MSYMFMFFIIWQQTVVSQNNELLGLALADDSPASLVELLSTSDQMMSMA